MLPVKRFYWDTPEYADAFATLLKCTGERVYVYQILRGIFSNYPAESRAIDWGAGGGDLTSLMLEHFRCVYAVEPHLGMRAVLAPGFVDDSVADITRLKEVVLSAIHDRFVGHIVHGPTRSAGV